MNDGGIPKMAPPMPYHTHISLWDLDNCTSDDKWRTDKIDWHLDGNARYDRYDAEMGKDKPAHISEWRIITQLSTPIFITGRREKWRKITRDFICSNLPMLRHGKLVWQSDPLVMHRPDDNNMRPAELKEMLLMQLVQEHNIPLHMILAAFDDVQSIVDMYLSHGIPAAVLRIHDPKLTYEAKDL